jgi:hypothetical protein
MAPVLMVVAPLVDCEEDPVLLGVSDGLGPGVMDGPGVRVGCEPETVAVELVEDGDVVVVSAEEAVGNASTVKPK